MYLCSLKNKKKIPLYRNPNALKIAVIHHRNDVVLCTHAKQYIGKLRISLRHYGEVMKVNQ